MTSQFQSGSRSRWTMSALAAALILSVLAAVIAVTIGAPLSSAAPGDAPITGAIHVDYDQDGEIDPGEDTTVDLPAGMTLTAYDSAGGSAVCAITDNAYSCDVAGLGDGPFRLELDPVEAGYSDTFTGSGYGPLTQIVEAGGSTNFGVVPPSSCSSAAGGELFVPCFVSGDRLDPSGYTDSIVGLNFDGSGAIEVLATKDETGAVWGVAYDEWDDVLYAGSFLKRHTDLGPNGIDGLYYTTDGGGTWLGYDLGASFGAEPVRDITGTAPDATSYDLEAFPRVGDTGVGDIDITPSGNTLLVTNLETNAVHTLDVSGVATGGTPTDIAQFPITSACAGDIEIFAVKTVDEVTALIGATCTGPTQADLTANVVQLDLTSGAVSDVLVVPLDYARACAGNDTVTRTVDTCNAITANGQTIADSSWQTWSNDFNDYGVPENQTAIETRDVAPRDVVVDIIRAQPILSDIEITDDGGLVLALTDRTSHQIGQRNCQPVEGIECATDDNGDGFLEIVKTIQAGDILRVCNTSGDPDAPFYAVEGQAGCATNYSTVANPATADPAIATNNGLWASGPYSADSEFFADGWDQPAPDAISGGTPHAETASGGLYVQPYSGLVVASAMDTENVASSGGVMWLDLTSGADVNGRDLYQFSEDPTGGSFAKAGGIPDVEGCLAPIQIGDYVWFDADGDGIQDPNEPAIGGVTVTLANEDGLTVATTTTDANGYYVFGPLDSVLPNTTYNLLFDVLDPGKTITGLPAGVTPADLQETVANAGEETRDSDMVDGAIIVTTGEISDHTLDAAYTVDSYDLALNITNLGDAVVAPGDPVEMSINVVNQGSVTSGAYGVTVYIPAGLELNDAEWTDNGDGTATYVGDAATELAPDGTTKLTVNFTAGAAGAKEFVSAEISSDSGDDVDSTADADDGGFDESPVDTNDSFDAIEDDHDFETITVTADPVYDLALIVTNLGPAVVEPGDPVEMSVLITNQGDADSGAYGVTVYIPAGLILNDANWTDNNDGTATYSGPDLASLAADGTEKLTVSFTAGDAGDKDFVFAEISSDSGEDADSTPDAENGLFVESPTATNDSIDDVEDDHDFETIQVTDAPIYDLALTIAHLPDGDGVFEPGASVPMTILVFNQGSEASGAYGVTAYIPEGFELNDPDWTDNGDGTATYTGDEATPIDPGASQKLTIELTAGPDEVMKTHVFAEISSDSGDDVDSTADAVDGGFDESPSTTDDSVDASEDDHDFETVTIEAPNECDLALRVTVDLDATGDIAPGEQVTFLIDVFNQGDTKATEISLINYIDIAADVPDFVAFIPGDNPDGTTSGDAALAYSWTESNGNGLASLTGSLPAGESITLPVVLTIADGADLANLVNTVEIADDHGCNDSDSTPDQVDDDLVVDDEIGDNPNDEDDHDIAIVPLLDLALRQQYSDGTNDQIVNPGELVTFNIEVFNQGNIPVKDIVLVDYIPAGLELADSDWTVKEDGTATITLTDVLGIVDPDVAGSGSVVVPITFRVRDTLAQNASVENIAEIAGLTAIAADGSEIQGLSDVDSDPDKTGGDTLVDDVIDNRDGDEDDHDRLGLTVGSAVVVVPTATPRPLPIVTATPVPPVIVVVTPTPIPVVVTATPVPKKATPLAVTGNESAPLVLLASALLVAGGTVLLVSRRREDQA